MLGKYEKFGRGDSISLVTGYNVSTLIQNL